ncbi:MAG TPA: hypothetical protein DCK93_06610 [Blastocatellia bacterium]|nr:hypothetical protein [Blastocatellia bacterium]
MIFRGPFAEVIIPEIPITSFVFQNAKDRGEKPALIDGPSGRVITYSQLADSISRVAASLATRGFKKGDVFGILSPNVPEYANSVSRRGPSGWHQYDSQPALYGTRNRAPTERCRSQIPGYCSAIPGEGHLCGTRSENRRVVYL